ncbi:MAG: integrase [Cyanobacteria bacterium P01_H01_bin.152]
MSLDVDNEQGFFRQILGMDFPERLARTNGRLKAARIPIRIQHLGNRLHLRGTFPPPPDSAVDKPYQQRLALGLSATPRNLAIAETKAKEVGIALEAGSFAWSDYRGEKAETVGEWVQRFHTGKFEGTALTWKTNYQAPFNKLPADAPLTLELLRQTLGAVRADKPDSRTQLKVYDAYRQLAAFAGLPGELSKGLKGSYSASEVDPRNLPSDRQIFEWRNGIKDSGWRWVFGMLAAYGLRGHEVYKADLADFPTVRIPPDTKTGARFCWPLFPEWAKKWKLMDRSLPPLRDIPNYTNGQLGTKTSKFFERMMDCNAYDLRHCYARRCFEFGYSPEFGAKMMGHSPDVHSRTYRRWIDEEVYWQIYQRGVNGSDRPECPGAED